MPATYVGLSLSSISSTMFWHSVFCFFILSLTSDSCARILLKRHCVLIVLLFLSADLGPHLQQHFPLELTELGQALLVVSRTQQRVELFVCLEYTVLLLAFSMRRR